MMYMKVVSLGKTRSEGEDKGGGGRGRGGDMYSLHKGHKSGTPTCCTHAATGYTLHMNTASVTYTLKGALIDLPNWKVAWLGHTW